jgi:hypothetical protein
VKVEGIIFAVLGVFFVIVTPIYWFLSEDPTGTSALALLTARRIGPRPEDRKDAEIAEGAGELGFFSPHSWWPLFCALSLSVCVLGIVFGWWLFLIGAGFGIVSVLGLVFEYYRGEHAH